MLGKTKLFKLKSRGFTVIELLVVIIIIGVLSTILLLTYSGVQQKEHNTTRVNDIKLIQSQLEAYYAENGKYPTIGDLNSSTWISANLKNLDVDNTKDPALKTGQKAFSSAPEKDHYAYQPLSGNGISCDNLTVPCLQYTLTATLGGGGTFVEKSLNT
jgi:prepilin-type N-terminal cleavage/methylation domain-containing protein